MRVDLANALTRLKSAEKMLQLREEVEEKPAYGSPVTIEMLDGFVRQTEQQQGVCTYCGRPFD